MLCIVVYKSTPLVHEMFAITYFMWSLRIRHFIADRPLGNRLIMISRHMRVVHNFPSLCTNFHAQIRVFPPKEICFIKAPYLPKDLRTNSQESTGNKLYTALTIDKRQMLRHREIRMIGFGGTIATHTIYHTCMLDSIVFVQEFCSLYRSRRLFFEMCQQSMKTTFCYLGIIIQKDEILSAGMLCSLIVCM